MAFSSAFFYLSPGCIFAVCGCEKSVGNAKNLILYEELMLVVLYLVAVAWARHRERAVSRWRKAPAWALSTLLLLLWGMYLEEGVQL